MDGWTWGLVGALVALLLLCAVLLAALVRARRRERAEVAGLREEIRGLADRLPSGPVSRVGHDEPGDPDDPEFVITGDG